MSIDELVRCADALVASVNNNYAVLSAIRNYNKARYDYSKHKVNNCWVEDTPTQAGWYWCRIFGFDKEDKKVHSHRRYGDEKFYTNNKKTTAVVKVFADNKEGIVDTVWMDGERYHLDQTVFLLWSMYPLEEPHEP